MRTVITGGLLVRSDAVFETHVAFEDDQIVEVGANIDTKGCNIIDATGCYIFPGGVDMHTRMALDANGKPSAEAFKQASIAALYGGTTTVVEQLEYPDENTNPQMQLDNYTAMLKNNSYIDYSFHQTFDSKVKEADLANVTQLTLNGYPSGFVTTYGKNRMSDEDMLVLMREHSRWGGTLFVHCESHAPLSLIEELHALKGRTIPFGLPSSHPAWTEAEAVLRITNLVRAGGMAMCISGISSAEAIEIMLRTAREGMPVLTETSPYYFLLNEESYRGQTDEGLKYVVYPPLRPQRDVDALWKALSADLINMVTSNHCGISFAHKQKMAQGNVFNCPAGMPGVETRTALLFTEGVLKERIPVTKLVEVTATAVTRTAGLRTKGRIEAGTDADIVIFDPNYERTITAASLHENCDYTPYEGRKLRGWAREVYIRGKKVIDNHQFVPTDANGSLTFRKAIAVR